MYESTPIAGPCPKAECSGFMSLVSKKCHIARQFKRRSSLSRQGSLADQFGIKAQNWMDAMRVKTPVQA